MKRSEFYPIKAYFMSKMKKLCSRYLCCLFKYCSGIFKRRSFYVFFIPNKYCTLYITDIHYSLNCLKSLRWIRLQESYLLLRSKMRAFSQMNFARILGACLRAVYKILKQRKETELLDM